MKKRNEGWRLPVILLASGVIIGGVADLLRAVDFSERISEVEAQQDNEAYWPGVAQHLCDELDRKDFCDE